ncbi:MAG TPA: haloacid dehalogenase [Chloroflexota bacterium]|jgi:translin
MSSLGLDSIETWARAELDRKNAAREQALRWSRELVRTCANSIRAVHRHEFDSAQGLIEEAHALNRRICTTLAEHADLYWAGYVQDAQKELAEACCTFALANRNPLPDPNTLGIAPAAYLNGLGEAVGEARRYVLDLLRRGEADGCEWLLGAMDEIYGLLVTLDYPDALTGGLRRTTDNTRGILEKTRGDLTLALRQDALVAALRAVERSVDGA